MSCLSEVQLILDLDGYRIHPGFIVRELGWCDLKGNNDSQHFYAPIKYSQLSWKDKRTVNHVYRHVHGLRFEAGYKEATLPQRDVEAVVRALYHRGVVAYKGGHLEKDLLQSMGIPCLDLEVFGCPKADQLYSSDFKPGYSCGFHCPKQEVFLFYQWLINKMSQK